MLFRSLRKVDTITILGGEPTLHPNLYDIIKYIKSREIICQLLTNGFLIYKDPEDNLLTHLVASGLDRMILHVDIGQEAYKDPFEVLHLLLAKTGKFNLTTSISWTIYKGEQGYLPNLIREFSNAKYLVYHP